MHTPPSYALDSHATIIRSLPSVTIVLVTWNSAAFIAHALNSIKDQTYPAECVRTVVVDNSSQDDTVALIRQEFPWVTVIAENVNHGFAGGNNIAMHQFPADYFALVNTDVVLDRNWLASLIGAM